MTTKHTPGPWTFGESGADDYTPGGITVWGDGEHNIIVCEQISGEQDARLIAAAPDLLAELENIANARRFEREYFDDDTSFADWAQSRARAAIAKATQP